MTAVPLGPDPTPADCQCLPASPTEGPLSCDLHLPVDEAEEAGA